MNAMVRNQKKANWSKWVRGTVLFSFFASISIVIHFVNIFDQYHYFMNGKSSLQVVYSILPLSSICLMVFGYLLLIEYNPITRFGSSNMFIDKYEYNQKTYFIRKESFSTFKLSISYLIFSVGVFLGYMSFFTNYTYYRIIGSRPLVGVNTSIVDITSSIAVAMAIIFSLALISSVLLQNQKEDAFNSYINHENNY